MTASWERKLKAFRAALVRRSGDVGWRWVETVPALVERLCDRCQIELTGAPALYGENNLLLPALRGADWCMLKLCGPGHDAMAEVTALLAWNG